MASLPRALAILCAALLAAVALTLGEPSPERARANMQCDLGATAVGTVTGAIGIGNPVGDACNAVADPVLGAAGHVLDPLGGLASRVGHGIFDQIARWAADGAVWLVGEVVALADKTTTPDLLGKGFLRSYRQMAQIAALLAAAMLVFAVFESLGSGEPRMLLRVFLVHVPVAAIGTSAAYVVVQLLLAATDGLSEAIAHSAGADSREFFKTAIKALGEIGAEGGAGLGTLSAGPGAGTAGGTGTGAVAVPAFVGFIVAILAALAAFLVWIELLMRDAAVYAVALFMPLALATPIWPRWASALRRTIELEAVVVFSKFVIVAVIALSASLAANAQGSVEQVLAAGTLLALACFSPLVLFKLVPFAESAVGAAFGRQGAGGFAVRTVEFGSSVQMMRRTALANWGAGAAARRELGGAAGTEKTASSRSKGTAAARGTAASAGARTAAGATGAAGAAAGIAAGAAAKTAESGAVSAGQGPAAASASAAPAERPAASQASPAQPKRASKPAPASAGAAGKAPEPRPAQGGGEAPRAEEKPPRPPADAGAGRGAPLPKDAR